jgi:Right handed beta helix region
MKYRLLLLSVVTVMGCVAGASTFDLGAQIIEADAKLAANAGQIHVTTSGTISEGRVPLSAGHSLICDGGVVISLEPGSYLYQNSNTLIQNCIISSTSTPITGEIQSENTSNLELDHVTFVGGGNLVYWSGVTHFGILSNTVVSITAVDSAGVRSGFYLLNCSRGRVDDLRASNFVFPVGQNDQSDSAVLGLNLSSYIRVDNPVIENVDASYVQGGVASVAIDGSDHILVSGGTITGNPNMDGILTQAFGQQTPSDDIAIIGVYASYNGGVGLNPAAHSLGDGLDIINTSHLYVSHCTLDGNGNPHDAQPAIWLFLDDDVFVADSDLSDGSAAGIASAGSINVRLVRDTINRNQGSGVFTEWQHGMATNVGPAVTFSSGVSGGFSVAWTSGTPFIFDGITYQIAAVTDFGHLTLASSPPDHSSPASWGVNTTQDIVDAIINDNGIGQTGGIGQQGIFWADGTTGTISGVTSTNTGIGAQLYGLQLANTATAVLINDNFSGNLEGGDGIDAGPQGVSTTRLSFPNQQVGTTSSSQTVSVWAGAVVIQQLVIDVSGDFSETNNCGTGLLAFSNCQVQVTFKPTTSGSRSGTLTITDSAPQSPKTVSLTGDGVSHGLGLSIATGGSASSTVAAGTTTKYSLSIGGAGISGTALLSCSGAPTGATCSVPATEVLNATTATAFTVSVSTTSSTSSALRPLDVRRSPLLWAAFLVGFVVLPAMNTRKRLLRRCLLMSVLLVGLCSCGGSGGGTIASKSPTSPSNPGNPSGSTGTPTGSYTLTVTAKVGSTSESIPLTLTVQ